VTQRNALFNIKSNLYYTRLIPFRVSRESGAHLRGFASRPTQSRLQRGESLATCERFDRLRIWIPCLPNQKRTSYHLCYLADEMLYCKF